MASLSSKRWLIPVAIVGAVLVIALGAAATVVAMRVVESSREPAYTRARDIGELETRITRMVTDQAAALPRKDEKAFLKPAKDQGIRDKLKLRYDNLVALKVTKFSLGLRFMSVSSTPDRWQAELVVSFCFVLPDCVVDKIYEPTEWIETGSGPELVSLEPAKSSDSWFSNPQPWETTKLKVASRGRVLIAAPERLEHRLNDVLVAADAAVPTADAFAIGSAPDLYRVYIADSDAWKSWYGNSPPDWSAGYAIPIGATHSDVVLNSEHNRASNLPQMLRHEMTHASTIQGAHQWVDNWWLIEGIAEVAGYAEGESPVDEDLRRFIRNGWDRKLDAEGPAEDASDQEAARAYSIAYLAVKRLEIRFGRAKLITFFDRVVEFGDDYEKASMTAFNVSWKETEADALSAIRRA
ncbi:MAG TPA: hypothetical protein VFC19_02690 [Candidatus Limnocylindrales bacterium]|nr:hypothetical protein [Candidatus Limnocylindrales bacterium]